MRHKMHEAAVEQGFEDLSHKKCHDMAGQRVENLDPGRPLKRARPLALYVGARERKKQNRATLISLGLSSELTQQQIADKCVGKGLPTFGTMKELLKRLKQAQA